MHLLAVHLERVACCRGARGRRGSSAGGQARARDGSRERGAGAKSASALGPETVEGGLENQPNGKRRDAGRREAVGCRARRARTTPEALTAASICFTVRGRRTSARPRPGCYGRRGETGDAWWGSSESLGDARFRYRVPSRGLPDENARVARRARARDHAVSDRLAAERGGSRRSGSSRARVVVLRRVRTAPPAPGVGPAVAPPAGVGRKPPWPGELRSTAVVSSVHRARRMGARAERVDEYARSETCG